MKILKFEDYIIKENASKIYTGDYVANHIIDITPEESDVPYYFIDNFIKPNNFILSIVKISDLLKNDKDLEEYVNSGEDRYGNLDEYETPLIDDIYYPIVIVNGEVLDGYSRITSLKLLGDDEVEAFVNV